MSECTKGSSRSLVITTACFVAVSTATPSVSQEVRQTPEEVASDVIVVTASRRADRLLDVPASIQAFNEKTLRQIGATGLNDIVNKTSGVTGFATGNGTAQFNIRGIQSVGGGVFDASTVGYYLDETPIANAAITPDLSLTDIERIDVLKGPQGTLYGEGSLGGTITLITNKPSFDRLSGSVTGVVSDTRTGGLNYSGSAVVNTPLSDKIALRIVGNYNRRQGFIDDVVSGDKDVDDAQTWSVRGGLRAAPTEDLDILLTLTHQSARGGANTIEAIDLDGALRQAFPQEYQDRFTLGALTVNYDLAGVRLVSATSYYDRRRRELVDGRNSIQALIDATGLDFPAGLRENPITPEKTFTQEVRAVSNGDGPFLWLIGGYYKNRKVSLFSTTVSPDLAAINPALGQIFSFDANTRFTEIAAFGEASLRISDALKITGGARAFRQLYRGTTAVSIIALDEEGSPVVSGTGRQPIRQKTKDVLFKASVDYKPTKDTTLYALFSQGVRAGGVNTLLFRPDIPRTYNSDAVDNFEVGAKARMLNGLISVDAAVYQLNWKNIQVPIDESEGISYITNAGSARTRGVEAGLTINPARSISFGGTFSIIDATIRRSLFLQPVNGAPGTVIPAGTPIPLTSKYKFNVFASANKPITETLALTAQADLEYVGARRNRLDTVVGGVAAPSERLPSYALVDLRLGIERENFSASLFVENLFDKKAVLLIEGLGTGRIVNQPRTIGLQAEIDF